MCFSGLENIKWGNLRGQWFDPQPVHMSVLGQDTKSQSAPVGTSTVLNCMEVALDKKHQLNNMKCY